MTDADKRPSPWRFDGLPDPPAWVSEAATALSALADDDVVVPVCDPIDLPPKAIRAHVATYYNVRLDWMCSKRRWEAVARPRMVAMFLMRRLTAMSFPDIGRMFDRDHSTVIHAVRTIGKLFDSDDRTFRDVVAIERQLLALAGKLMS